MNLSALWDELVTAALLGTDRREPPMIDNALIGDTVADAARPDPATRMLDTVAAVSAARRAAFVPAPSVPGLQPPDVDQRPLVPADAVQCWRDASAEWPVLDDEWMIAVINGGWRLSPDVLVDLLIRTRKHAVQRARVQLAAGPLGPWLVAAIPELAASVRPPRDLDPSTLLELPELPIPVELRELAEFDASHFATGISGWFASQQVGAAQRPVLVNLFARCRPGVLLYAAEALGQMSSGIAQSLAQLCNRRHAMLVAVGAA